LCVLIANNVSQNKTVLLLIDLAYIGVGALLQTGICEEMRKVC